MKQARWVSPWLVGLVVGMAAAANMPQALALIPRNPGRSELDYEHPACLRGTVYAGNPADHKVLFKFSRVASRSGSLLHVQHEFTYPDGKLAARERVVYADDALVSYALEELQIGAVGSASLRRNPQHPAQGNIEFAYARAAGDKVKTHTESLTENTLVADMVGTFLASHWEALGRGDKVKCRFIVVPHRETVGFTFLKDSEAKCQGREACIIRMEATSPVVAMVVDPMFFTIEKAPPHRVLQYAGRTTPKIQSGGKWKDLDAVTVFDWDSVRDFQ